MKRDAFCEIEETSLQIENLAGAIYALGFFVENMDNEFDRVKADLVAYSIQEIANTITEKSRKIVDIAFEDGNSEEEKVKQVNRI